MVGSVEEWKSHYYDGAGSNPSIFKLYVSYRKGRRLQLYNLYQFINFAYPM